jgi:hypothetical protein
VEVGQDVKSYNATTQMLELYGGLTLNGPLIQGGGGAATYLLPTPLVFGANVAINAATGNNFVLTMTSNAVFAINAPTNPPGATFGQRLSIMFRNASGGAAGAGTFDVIYKMVSNTLAVIANGFSRTYEFEWNGTNWVEVFETAADVAN